MTDVVPNWETFKTSKKLYGFERRFATRFCLYREHWSPGRFHRAMEYDSPEGLYLAGAGLCWVLISSSIMLVAVLASVYDHSRPVSTGSFIGLFIGIIVMVPAARRAIWADKAGKAFRDIRQNRQQVNAKHEGVVKGRRVPSTPEPQSTSDADGGGTDSWTNDHCDDP